MEIVRKPNESVTTALLSLGAIPILVCLLFASVGCTVAGFAVGESLDRQNVTPDTLATDQLKEAVQLGKEVRVSLVSGEILYGKVNQVDEHRVFMNQRETYPWPHGGHVQRNLPLESIVTVERLDYSIRWKIIGAAAGLVVDISLVMFIMAMSSLGSLG